MATVQQSIDIKVPAHAVFSRLMQFEDYPQFMEEVETVQKLDDRHLHWTTRMANRNVEWDAEITEQEPDRCIAWRNTSGPTNAGRVEVQQAGPQESRVTLTLESDPQQVPGSMAGESEAEMARRLKMDMARLKDFIEARGTESGGWRAQAQGAPINTGMEEGDRGEPRNAPIPTSSYAAGSEGWSGEEEAASAASPRTAAEQWNDSAGSVKRHVGQMPQDTSAERHGGTPAPDATGKSMQANESSAALQGQAERSMQPGASGNTALGGTAAAVGAAGGTEASAGARMAAGPSTDRQTPAGGAISAGNPSAAAGTSAAGGTELGSSEAGSDASDTRNVARKGTPPRTGGNSGPAKP